MGKHIAALFLSIGYHMAHVKYIHGRIATLGHAYQIRIILLLIDKPPEVIDKAMIDISKICIVNKYTLIWTKHLFSPFFRESWNATRRNGGLSNAPKRDPREKKGKRENVFL